MSDGGMPDYPVPPSPMGDVVDEAWEVEPSYVKERLSAGDAGFVLLDCRRPNERPVASIEGSEFLPMQELASRVNELEEHAEKEMVVYCHHGRRSLRVTAFLREQGFENVKSMAGGIDRWSEEIDQSVPVY